MPLRLRARVVAPVYSNDPKDSYTGKDQNLSGHGEPRSLGALLAAQAVRIPFDTDREIPV